MFNPSNTERRNSQLRPGTEWEREREREREREEEEQTAGGRWERVFVFVCDLWEDMYVQANRLCVCVCVCILGGGRIICSSLQYLNSTWPCVYVYVRKAKVSLENAVRGIWTGLLGQLLLDSYRKKEGDGKWNIVNYFKLFNIACHHYQSYTYFSGKTP